MAAIEKANDKGDGMRAARASSGSENAGRIEPRKGSRITSMPRLDRWLNDLTFLRRAMLARMMCPNGITVSQWALMNMLWRTGDEGIMQVELARLLDCGKVTIGGLVDRLEASGFVERRPDRNDRRLKRVFLTTDGVRTMRRAGRASELIEGQILEGISMEEWLAVEKVVMRIKENLQHLPS